MTCRSAGPPKTVAARRAALDTFEESIALKFVLRYNDANLYINSFDLKYCKLGIRIYSKRKTKHVLLIDKIKKMKEKTIFYVINKKSNRSMDVCYL